MQTDREGAHERSIPELLRDLSQETATLVRQEMQLARVELTEKGKTAGASATLFGGTAVFGLGAFGAITTALIAALALLVPLWAAALIVAVVYGIAAAIFAQRGKKELKELVPVAPATTQTVKEDVAWAKSQTKSGAK